MVDHGDRKAAGFGKYARAGIAGVGGAIPFVGGLLAAIGSFWGETEQERANKLLQQWLQMLEDELREKGKTIAEIAARLDMSDDDIAERIESPEYQAILKKAFRAWASIDSEGKREKVRNILSNAAATRITSDDVVKLFIEWLTTYSDFHFEVIGEVYRHGPIGRGDIWKSLGRAAVREDSADADLYRLLIRDLSTGGIVRQKRETDYEGNFLKKAPVRSGTRPSSAVKSAFENEELYVLTDLGSQFVHYAMNELAPRITFAEQAPDTDP